VKAKHAVVDTEGVGEPLRALVDTMVRPDPNTRPQTAAELLRIVGGGSRGGSPAGTSIESLLQDDPATAPSSQRKTAQPKRPVETKKKGKGGLVAALLALGVIGGGAYYATGPGKDVVQGLFAQLPTAKPYAMTLRYDGDGATVSGHAPSAESASKLAASLSNRLPTKLDPDAITAANGVPNTSWQATITAMASELAKLEEGVVEFRDDQISFEGKAGSETTKSQIESKARTIAKNGQYRIALALTAPAPVPATVPDPVVDDPKDPDVVEVTPAPSEPPEPVDPPPAPEPVVKDPPVTPPNPDVSDAPITSPDGSSKAAHLTSRTSRRLPQRLRGQAQSTIPPLLGRMVQPKHQMGRGLGMSQASRLRPVQGTPTLLSYRTLPHRRHFQSR